MFQTKKRGETSLEGDMQLLIEVMDRMIQGDSSEVDISAFQNPVYGEKLNQVLHALKKANNPYVMRMNDTVKAVGDNTLIKETFDRVNSLTESIHTMKETSNHMEDAILNISDSIGDIRTNTHGILHTFEEITPQMNESIQIMNDSSMQMEAVNGQMQRFQENIEKIGEIVEMVKQVASRSNLLALNASIEAARAGTAGRGFAVVATQMRQLATNTAEFAENIIKYVMSLSGDTQALAAALNETADKLKAGNAKAETSFKDMSGMSLQIADINENVDSIAASIDNQTTATADFSRQLDSLSESYSALSQNCVSLGQHIFRIGRYVDKTRSDMVRKCSEITDVDWLNVFRVDHFILVWRLYNNIVGFEHLEAKQVNNPSGCKLGKWLANQDKPELLHSVEFNQLVATHKAIHDNATFSWEAGEKQDTEMALKYFQDAYASFTAFDAAINGVLGRLKAMGHTEQTEFVEFAGK